LGVTAWEEGIGVESSLEGKVALVTGSGSGIGRSSARAFGREGAKVVIADVDVAGGEETAQLIVDAGGEASFVATDVSKPGQVDAAVARAQELYGGLDCAHNNAGIEGALAETHEYPEDEWDRIVAVNLKGVWLSMRAEIPAMLERGKGAIVNTSSTFGLVAVPGCAGYVATKHAVAGLTKAAALENARRNIRVNAVCPGAVDTPLLDRFFDGIGNRKELAEAYAEEEPIGRLGQPDEIGEAVVWLCSDAASFVTGLPMPVDGGWLAK
jgi:NAD(P)-dependent dehydrogenase (short-subunit alcohol dehydrogenase family)